MSSARYFCGSCKKELKIAEKPCPYCGSDSRDIKKEIQNQLRIHHNIRVRQKPRGFGKFMKEILGGWFPSRDLKLQEGVYKERIIDREEDKYREIVTDAQTGAVLCKKEEKLSKHK